MSTPIQAMLVATVATALLLVPGYAPGLTRAALQQPTPSARVLPPLWFVGLHEVVIEIVRRVRLEFDGMPGRCLTQLEAEQILGLEPHESSSILGALVDAGYLRYTTRGFLRA